jgi:hypothetical protein
VVGAGSDTTYEAQLNLTKIYMESALSGCVHNTGTAVVPSPGPAQNSCKTTTLNNLGNFQGDTLAQANAVGSGGGIGALNANTGTSDGNDHLGTANPLPNPARLAESATVTGGSNIVTDATMTTADIGRSIAGVGIPINTYIGPASTAGSIHLSSAPDQQFDINATASGTSVDIKQYACVGTTSHHAPDFARSSRAPGTASICSNELTADTFWGFAQDGVQVVGFNQHGTWLDSVSPPSAVGVAPTDLTFQQIYNIWNCSGGTGSGIGVNRIDGTGGAGTVVVASGNSTVQDNQIQATDVGHAVTGTGIPSVAFVSAVVANTSFVLSSSNTSSVPINATAAGTSVTIANTGSRIDGTGGAGTVVVSSGSATVSDSQVQSGDFGHDVSGTGIPASTFVGTVNPTAHTFKLSSSPTHQVDVLATAPGTAVTVGLAHRVRWSDVIQNLPGGAGGPNDADIVPWKMNTASGTFATFQTFVINGSNAPSGWSPNNQPCDRDLVNSAHSLPLENDIKPLINDPTTIGTGSSNDNPENWLWWGSFGVMNQFSFTSQFARGGTTYQAIQARINGDLAGFGNILDQSWAMSRTLYHVTRKADADCPKAAGQTVLCDFSNNHGPAITAGMGGNPTATGNDIDVTGGMGGKDAAGNLNGTLGGVSGSVKEYTRWLCRQSANQQGLDPLTGQNYFTGITSAINAAGFTIINSTDRTPGTRCHVVSS